MVHQHTSPAQWLGQLFCTIIGALVMAATGAWLLPGIPLVLLIKVMYDHPAPLLWFQSTEVFQLLSNSVSNRLLIDPRNKALLWVSLGSATGTTLLTANLVYAQLMQPNSFPWAALLLRQAFMAGVLSQAFAAKHRESHNRTATYKHAAVQAVLGRVNEWWTSVWYGNLPELDRCGHGFVHHRNEPEVDDWTNAHLDRTSVTSFLQYVVTAGVYHNSGLGPMVHFIEANLPRLVKQMGTGMAAYYGAAALTWAMGGWRLFVLLWAWPLVANCGYVSVINWCWHAFADPQDPSNFLGSTITVTDWPGDFFAKGYHVPHHLKAAGHYSTCKPHYEQNPTFYKAHNCVVLHGSDPLSLWVNLLTANWGYFATRYENFYGMSEGEVMAFTRYRTRPTGAAPTTALEASAVARAAKGQRAAMAKLQQQENAAAAASGKAAAGSGGRQAKKRQAAVAGGQHTGAVLKVAAY